MLCSVSQGIYQILKNYDNAARYQILKNYDNAARY